jgi:hypothetical protein
MHNSQLVDLHDVEAYWKTRHLVDERQLTYYLRWLQRFLAGPGGDSRLSAQDAQRAFVEQLEHNGNIADWQVRQASRAVELYQKHYLRYRAETNVPGADSGVQCGAFPFARSFRTRHGKPELSPGQTRSAPAGGV